ncbi:ABC transporter ATP-binding protein [Metasolibacillus sp.]|uniref:ATP-binding cassette domain-containing protein n=1 Tax=Metasolibacillus sp. TaxID=2703680 RepID=UPI0025D13AC4|nr:ABC transporter ATP-binding protein [Metasolibacillus sp.]MCT6926311.1 ABC transporter ATP-binding protein [Metasolibacillus sp.]MCT6942560.1 ABC transporter ATP-binding protein [Metasolibacillus sp.]
MLQLQNVTFSYVRKPVLQQLSLDIAQGQMIGLVGENGSGKSTLLQLITGILQPTEGQILLNGAPVTRRSASQIAFLPDTDLFYDFYTAEQLFRFYETQFADFSYDKANIIGEFLEIERGRKLRQLSKGQRGRVKMAATLGREVPLYVMDEPFAGLDPLVKESLLKGLIQFTDMETQTILLSTHELYEVEPILDEVLLLRDGHIAAQGQLEMIRDEHNQNAVEWMKERMK